MPASPQAALAPAAFANVPASGADSERSSAVVADASPVPSAAALWKLKDCSSSAGACCASVLMRSSVELEGRLPPPLVVAWLLLLNLLATGSVQLLSEGAIGKCQGQLLLLHETPQGGPLAELLPRTAAFVNTSAAPTAPPIGCLGKSPCVPALLSESGGGAVVAPCWPAAASSRKAGAATAARVYSTGVQTRDSRAGTWARNSRSRKQQEQMKLPNKRAPEPSIMQHLLRAFQNCC